jgi:glycosyltransferase involved in cell wall biosynthesis
MSQMREHDVLLVPSLFENAGTVVAEAASQGLPTIAREVGGMPEMTNYGESGYLFNTNEKLDEILDSMSTKELSSKGLLAKEWAQQLKPELIATQYAEAFL